MIVRIEVTHAQGITRVGARALNAQARKAGLTFAPLSGQSTLDEARALAHAIPGAEVREVAAAALAGPDKAAHTRVLKASAQAQAQRATRKEALATLAEFAA